MTVCWLCERPITDLSVETSAEPFNLPSGEAHLDCALIRWTEIYADVADQFPLR
jgi:hypothetical protein